MRFSFSYYAALKASTYIDSLQQDMFWNRVNNQIAGN